MKEQLKNILLLLRSSSAPTRIVLVAASVAILLVGGYSTYRARNPHMGFLVGDLDNVEFSAVTAALGSAGIRFDTSGGGAPYTVFVEESRKFDARNAIALEGAMSVGPRGISTDSGSSSVFKSSGERKQEMNARFWQEVEMQLERLNWVSAATVTASMPLRASLGRMEPAQVAVVLKTRGLVRPDAQQRQTVATLVQRAFGVPSANLVITDQHGNNLFDGSEDQSLNELLEFELEYADAQTDRAQEMLDRSFGPGMAVVSVKGEWEHTRTESIGEAMDPKKLVVMETASDTSTPASSPGSASSPGLRGGPAGTQANISLSSPPPPQPAAEPATTTDTQKNYDYATTTTHRLQDKPTLTRLSITLLVDSAMEDRLTVAADFVKNLVGYREGRDEFQAGAVPLATVMRDSEGNPITPDPVPVEVPNATMTMLFERGVEIVAALAFVFLLMRSLRRAKPRPVAEPVAAADAEPEEEEEVDLDLLARRKVEEILENDPEKVGALLTRWALGEEFYAEAK